VPGCRCAQRFEIVVPVHPQRDVIEHADFGVRLPAIRSHHAERVRDSRASHEHRAQQAERAGAVPVRAARGEPVHCVAPNELIDGALF
jgi:hypothetical protein